MEETAQVSRPGPAIDPDSAPYWRGLRSGQILLQKCANCDEVRFPPMPGCPRCGWAASSQVVASGTGRVYSWIVVHRPIGTFSEEELPAVIATVELDEGCRVLGRLEGASGAAVDLPVTARFVDHGDWTELAFAAAGER